jgi:Spy/CpxP family protein refolding chaperone
MAAIRTIVDGSRARGETLRAELRTANAQMRALLSQALPDEAAVMQQADTIGALELAERKNRLQAMLQIRTLLTSAQRQELIRRQGELYSRRRPDLMQACQADSTNLCPDATHWRSRMQCLHNHLEELSETCRATIQAR